MEDHIFFDRERRELHLLDQRLLPVEERTVVCRTLDDVVRALQVMVVRGAPAIGVTAGFGAALALAEVLAGGVADWRTAYAAALERLAAARPTAVNLRWGVDRIRRLWQAAGEMEGPELLARITDEALAMQAEDIAICRAIGRAGAEVVGDGQTVLTHCNAGALATAGYGTALGVIRGACEAGKRVRVIADETRPFLQGRAPDGLGIAAGRHRRHRGLRQRLRPAHEPGHGGRGGGGG